MKPRKRWAGSFEVELRISQSALQDLLEIQAYYGEHGAADIGEEFLDAILRHSETLLDHPDIGRVVPEFKLERLRELIHPPFRIVYLRQGAEIVLVRVWRSERQLTLSHINLPSERESS